LTFVEKCQRPNVDPQSNFYAKTQREKAWRENINNPKALNDMRPHIHDFKSYQNIRMTMGGWFPKDQEPPVMEPPPSTEWALDKAQHLKA
jgi:hypothetical protein